MGFPRTKIGFSQTEMGFPKHTKVFSQQDHGFFLEAETGREQQRMEEWNSKSKARVRPEKNRFGSGRKYGPWKNT